MAERTGNAPAPLAKPALLGAVFGLDAIGTCLALATLIFAGPLAAAAGLGTALFLLGTLVSTLALARFGGFRGALGIAQDPAIAIIAPAVASAAALAAQAGRDPLPTALAVVGVGSLATGFCLFLIGRLRLGRLARLMPYPVAVGFLAGSGWLLSYAAISLLASGATSPGEVLDILGGSHLWAFTLPAIGFAVTVLVAQRLVGGLVALLGTILLSLAAFYLVLLVTGTDLATARDLGWLPVAGEGVALSRLHSDFLAQIDWRAVASALPSIGVVVLVSLCGVALNTSGTELALRADVDFERELEVTGLSNIVLGLFGGLVSYLSAGSTIIADRLGLRGPTLAWGYAVVVLAGVFLAGPIAALVPVFFTAGLLLFIGLAMLQDWLVDSRHRLSRLDWGIVVVIVAVTAWRGMLSAITVGLVIALLIFVVSYARIPVLRRSLFRPAPRSAVDRSPDQTRALEQNAGRIIWAPLQGYLFFGSVDRLATEIRSVAQGGRTWLILDFTLVSGLDSSACAMLEKLAYLADRLGLRVLVCGVEGDVAATMENWQRDFLTRNGIRNATSRDKALEWAETELLDSLGLRDEAGQGFHDLLLTYLPDADARARLADLFHPVDLVAGQVLIRQGERSTDVYVVDSGRLSVFLRPESGGGLRLRSMTAGAITGEIAAYLGVPRQADVVADVGSRVWRLSGETVQALESGDPALAAQVHELMARALADKLVHTNGQLRDLAG